MQTLKGICLSDLGPNLASLVLSGSFGRGEGSVLLHPDGSIEPLRDYDMRVILYHHVKPHVIDEIRSKFMRITGLGQVDERFSGEGGFSLTLEPLTITQLHSAFVRGRDLRAYDHSWASRVIYGMDYSLPLRFPASEIPKVNGLRLLYKKMVGLVGHFPGPPVETADVRRTLLYECDKTFVEICTALVLLVGSYVPSYRARAELFADNWERWFPDLAVEMPHLAEQIRSATHAKLYPVFVPSQSPHEAFEQAREALLAVHRFYVHQLYGTEVLPGRAGCNKMQHILQHEYFRVPVTKWLNRWRLDNSLMQWGLNAAYHCLMRFKFARTSGVRLSQAVWKSLQVGQAPLLIVFLAAWCALAAARSTPDETLLACAEYMLDCLPWKRQPSFAQIVAWERYSLLREQLVEAFSLCHHNRRCRQ